MTPAGPHPFGLTLQGAKPTPPILMHTQYSTTDTCSTHSQPLPPTFDSPLPLAALDNIALYSYNTVFYLIQRMI